MSFEIFFPYPLLHGFLKGQFALRICLLKLLTKTWKRGKNKWVDIFC